MGPIEPSLIISSVLALIGIAGFFGRMRSDAKVVGGNEQKLKNLEERLEPFEDVRIAVATNQEQIGALIHQVNRLVDGVDDVRKEIRWISRKVNGGRGPSREELNAASASS